MKITSTKTDGAAAPNILVSGPAGFGKTTAIGTLPGKALIVSAESGLMPLRDKAIDVVEVTSVDDVREVHAHLRAGGHGYDWVALDSLTEIAEVCLAKLKEDFPDPRQAYGAVIDQVLGITRAFRDLPIGFYATAQQEKVRDEASGNMLYGVSMPGAKLGQKVPHLFDFVFAIRMFRIEGEDEPRRALQTGSDAQYACKDRSGALNLHEPVDIGLIVSKLTTNGAQGGAKKEKK